MVLAKSKNAVGLGNSLMNDRFKNRNSNMHRGNEQQHRDITRTDATGNSYITPAKKEAEWMKMRSVTEQDSLNEFLSTAELAGTDFTAEKMNNVKIVHTDQRNPYLLTREEERKVVRKQKDREKEGRLSIPRRPPWDEGMGKMELETREREAMMEWRRNLAALQEVDDLLLTPFERNIEVWRQLWRVIERSDLIVQIVDARNPLLFRCEDLERYVREVDGRKRNLLLVNKADMMTERQRREWAEYFVRKGVDFRFFSAELARELNEVRYGDGEGSDEEYADVEDRDVSENHDIDGSDISESDVEEEIDFDNDTIAKEAAKIDLQDEQEENDQWIDEEAIATNTDDPTTTKATAKPLPLPQTPEDHTRILTTSDLESLFLSSAPTAITSPTTHTQKKTTIGLVGYPNVGKSSTINALLGSKKVSVSATPGKTKHFQTIHLSDQILLCDCPGLVFPNFATTKAELVVNGVLPIDQLREYTGPAALVAQRIPKSFLEAVYGIRIITRSVEEGGTGRPTGEEVLRAFARARGFWTQGLGQPDESRAARHVLKDFVKGKLPFVHPAPIEDEEGKVLAGYEYGREFNRELYDLVHLPEKRRAQRAASQEAYLHNTSEPSLMDSPDIIPLPRAQGPKGAKLDKNFFGPGQGGGVVVQPFHYKYSAQGQAQGQGKELSGRKFKALKALEQDVDPKDLKGLGSKKHFKGNGKAERKKGRANQGLGGGDYD